MDRLVIVENYNVDPYTNLRVEDEIIHSSFHGCGLLMIWRNSPCLVLGRFQLAEYEVNESYVKEMNIPVLKRLTGGGTVYHDLGNLNLTFCKSKDDILFSHYILEEAKGITNIIADAIRDLDIRDVTVDERNSIFVCHKKVSGCSTAVSNHNFFYHSSLLVNADLVSLNKCIKWKEEYPPDKHNFVKSHRSEVENLSDFVPGLTAERVAFAVRNAFLKQLHFNSVETKKLPQGKKHIGSLCGS
jgi:lipoate-protein ligase A